LTTLADWTVLDIPGVRDIATKAANSVATEYANVVDFDDQHQDALILLATHAELIRGHRDSGNLGLVYRWLWCRLVDRVRPEAYRSNRTIRSGLTMLDAA
jgi:hypothetical protein